MGEQMTCQWCGEPAVEHITLDDGDVRKATGDVVKIRVPVRAWACAKHAASAKEEWVPAHNLLRRKAREYEQPEMFPDVNPKRRGNALLDG